VVDKKGHAALGFSSSVSPADLGEILSLGKVARPGRQISRALNLDGGSSSGMRQRLLHRRAKTVRDFIAIAPR
jgi:hypothetical protein